MFSLCFSIVRDMNVSRSLTAISQRFGSGYRIAALLSAPWQVLWQASLLLGLAGLAGVSYVFQQ